MRIKTLSIKIEKKIEKIPKHLQLLLFAYILFIAIIFGMFLSLGINFQNLREIKKAEAERINLERSSIERIVND